MHIKLSVITRYEEWVANLAELGCTTNNNNNKRIVLEISYIS